MTRELLAGLTLLVVALLASFALTTAFRGRKYDPFREANAIHIPGLWPALIFGIVGALMMAWVLLSAANLPNRDIIVNVGTGLLGITITVIFIGYFVERHSQQQYQRQLIRMLASKAPDLTRHAVSELRYHGWLMSGALANAFLGESSLQDIDLRGANLVNAYLVGANLSNTCLRYSDLKSANLRKADMKKADLHAADLRSAFIYDADLRDARSIEHAYLSGTYYNVGTQWPVGFPPPPEAIYVPAEFPEVP